MDYEEEPERIRPGLIAVVLIIGFGCVAVAVITPNLLESAVSAQEAAAATALKSGIFPAEVQFQAGDYCPDIRNPGTGDFATVTRLGAGRAYPLMSGAIATTYGQTLNLLPPTYHSATPQISGYVYAEPVSVPINQTKVWAVINRPASSDQGRRLFAINQAGNIFASTPTLIACSSTTLPMDSRLFGVSLDAVPDKTQWVPYRR